MRFYLDCICYGYLVRPIETINEKINETAIIVLLVVGKADAIIF
jgi:hypothetical protein